MTATQSPPLHLACLCAAWCRLCDGYAAVFADAVAVLRQARPWLQAHWVDIEDDSELVGDLDVETFPTLVLVQGPHTLFAGALTPQPETLLRVLRAALDGADRGAPAAPQPPEVLAFAERLLQRPAQR
jgi:hypothetical protein